jgi:hypothetical protein
MSDTRNPLAIGIANLPSSRKGPKLADSEHQWFILGLEYIQCWTIEPAWPPSSAPGTDSGDTKYAVRLRFDDVPTRRHAADK